MEHHCFTFYMDKVFGLWVWATKKVSVETGLFVISTFWTLVSVTVEKLCLEALGTCWRVLSHASLSSLLAGDGRHESVWIRCTIDGGIVKAVLWSKYEERPVVWLVCVIFAWVFLYLCLIVTWLIYYLYSDCFILVAWYGPVHISLEKRSDWRRLNLINSYTLHFGPPPQFVPCSKS